MKITVNGHDEHVPEPTTIAALIEQFKMKTDKVAVELNRKLVRAAHYGTTLKEGDVVELVTFVGGG